MFGDCAESDAATPCSPSLSKEAAQAELEKKQAAVASFVFATVLAVFVPVSETWTVGLGAMDAVLIALLVEWSTSLRT